MRKSRAYYDGEFVVLTIDDDYGCVLDIHEAEDLSDDLKDAVMEAEDNA